MKHVSRNAEKDCSSLFLGVILAALVVMVCALMFATAHSFAGRVPGSVNQSAKSSQRPLLHQASLCVVDRSSTVSVDRCGTKLSADH